MTYKVFGGTLSLTQAINHFTFIFPGFLHLIHAFPNKHCRPYCLLPVNKKKVDAYMYSCNIKYNSFGNGHPVDIPLFS